ncbi:MAG TPA: aconitase/3-isopropylmalate dehydratase large subunit family protein [Vicinamibacterales bacterium]|jgi:3-isopropylmalate/(R)-2-methylmalate dehydratase large subunit
MPGKTISEKILSRASGKDARAGELVICRVDYAMGTDGSVPMAIDYFEQMGGQRVFDAARIVFVMDHYAPRPGSPAFDLQARMRAFAATHGIPVHDAGEGVCHQLMVETGRTRPGRLLVGADSHSVTGGALNAFATGIGSSDLAATMICGRIWLKVPETIRVVLTGEARPGVFPKDMALALAGVLGADGAAYQALEFDGPGSTALDVEDRLVLSNMSVEMGAKAGVFRADRKTVEYLAHADERRADGTPSMPVSAHDDPVESDPDAVFSRQVTLDLAQLTPRVALPHAVDHVASLEAAAGTPIQMVFIGTCTGGRARDIHQALAVLRAAERRRAAPERSPLAPGVLLVITPASRKVEAELRLDGSLDALAAMGATITPPGCGPCCGTAGPIPGDGVNVISTANRNFKARMGTATASIYLASPASCAAAAVTGCISDPGDIAKEVR